MMMTRLNSTATCLLLLLLLLITIIANELKDLILNQDAGWLCQSVGLSGSHVNASTTPTTIFLSPLFVGLPLPLK